MMRDTGSRARSRKPDTNRIHQFRGFGKLSGPHPYATPSSACQLTGPGKGTSLSFCERLVGWSEARQPRGSA